MYINVEKSGNKSNTCSVLPVRELMLQLIRSFNDEKMRINSIIGNSQDYRNNSIVVIRIPDRKSKWLERPEKHPPNEEV